MYDRMYLKEAQKVVSGADWRGEETVWFKYTPGTSKLWSDSDQSISVSHTGLLLMQSEVC